VAADAYDVYDGFKVATFIAGEKWRQNCYLLTAGNDAALIDPGYDVEARIIGEVEGSGCALRYCFLTHAHHDHLAGAQKLLERFSLPLIVHPGDKRLLMHAPMYSARFAGRPLQRPANVRWLDAAAMAELAGRGFCLLHTPGHTIGGISIFFRQVAFSGDTIFRNYLGMTDLPGGNREKLMESVGRFFSYAQGKGTSCIYPGHGDKWEAKDAFAWLLREEYDELREFAQV
jgi:glyoxylase-like metal-dependent hydrolase (beta-lactamase superfamily II)